MTIHFNANQAVRTEDAGGHGVAGNVKVASGEYSLSAALTLNQVIPMLAIPRGARIVGAGIAADDLDTNGAPTLVLGLGDSGDDDRLIAGSTVGQTSGVDDAIETTGILYKYDASTVISITVKTAPATGAASGKLKAWVSYVLD